MASLHEIAARVQTLLALNSPFISERAHRRHTLAHTCRRDGRTLRRLFAVAYERSAVCNRRSRARARIGVGVGPFDRSLVCTITVYDRMTNATAAAGDCERGGGRDDVKRSKMVDDVWAKSPSVRLAIMAVLSSCCQNARGQIARHLGAIFSWSLPDLRLSTNENRTNFSDGDLNGDKLYRVACAFFNCPLQISARAQL